MADNVWSSAGDTNGNTVGNWSLGALAATDNLVFNATSTVDCTFSANISCAGFSMPGGYTGTINMNTRTFDCTGNWTFGAAATISAGASLITFTGAAAQTYTSNGQQAYDIIINRTTATSTMTFAGPTLAHTVTASSTNTQAISWTGTTMSVSGNLTLDGSGTLNCGNGITATGASSIIAFNSTLGTLTASSLVLTMNTSTNGQLNVNKLINPAGRLVIGSNAVVTIGGTNSRYLPTSSSALLTFVDGGTLTINVAIFLSASTSSAFFSYGGAAPTINGTGNITFQNGVNNTFGPFVYTGSGTITLQDGNGGSGGGSYTLTGSISTPAALVIKTVQAGTNWSFNAASYNITCAALTIGSSSATNIDIFNFGSGTHTISSLAALTTGTTTVNLQTSQWTCTGNWTFGSNHTITGTAASQSVTITNTSTVTSNDKAFPGTFAINAAGKTITLADALTIATGGKVTVTAFTAFAGDKYIIFAGSGSITISTAVSNRLRTAVAGSTITWNTGANTWTVPAYAASDWGPAAGADVAWRSSTPGTQYKISAPAGVVVTNMNPQDCNNIGTEINGSDASNLDEGNNIGWSLPALPSIVGGHFIDVSLALSL